MEKLSDFLNYEIIKIGDSGHLTVKMVLVVIAVFILTAIILRGIKKLLTRKLPEEDKLKFTSVFSFARYFIYLVVVFITMQNMGVQMSAILAASAALLVGIGLALQTFFQDIISGIFILLDQSVHVGDIIEIDGKVGRVVEIKLRTTRAVTIDNKVLVIPNHKYLTSILYNWTENGTKTRESVSVGVAYGSDVDLVKELLLQAAKTHPKVMKHPPPLVLFMNFGDSSLNFKLIFTLNNSFEAVLPQSDIRFEINRLFKENNITIPFPQRDVHLYNN
ncbi:mechanosensitive ion channel [Flavobacteriaceae bacterium S0825]|uniref:mechanosensitive ion channel family protein n=1 Tax=Gaetbulibacter sp. S0825 TaxID=2720084 RepID=UPI001431B641|nr:mechanosensitive ion channel domain-containing protein [Gaetbulibacter sp. S0825]MCK0110316.1 mechanosensitive ion channel [Flavobacteriaceae bacterium S0825]NIX65945.1 mechanosensitive ion channel [Gaetbulibacter sp. S0825]